MSKPLTLEEMLAIYEFEKEAGAFLDSYYCEFIELIRTGSVTLQSERGPIVLTLKAELPNDN